MNENNIVLFDGICNLCHFSVNFITKRDRTGKFVFHSLQSARGMALIQEKFRDMVIPHSVVYIAGDKLFIKSDAALRILKDIGFPWASLYLFILVPRFIRDAMYNLIARYRYRIFGIKRSCAVPTLKN